MLIKLIPRDESPTILFSLTYGALPKHLPIPTAYATLLQNLQSSVPALKIPTSIHALDKTTYLVEVLQEVIFDLATGVITCVWVDGGSEEWLMDEDSEDGRKCWRMLGSVLDDVSLSAQAAQQQQQQQTAPSAPAPPKSVTRHKKQRSSLRSFVSSLVPNNASQNAHVSAAPLAIMPARLPPPPPMDSPRNLRRRARSTLVEVYRRFVLPELNKRFPAGQGYFGWIARSMLFGVDQRMRELERIHPQAGFRGSESSFSSESDDDDNSDARSWSTDTDGSSIHTPPDCHEVTFSDKMQEDVPSVAMVPSPIVSKVCTQHESLQRHAASLRLLLSRLSLFQHQVKQEEKRYADQLEEKSKRRAWSNAHLPASQNLSKPIRSSPLRASFVAEDANVDADGDAVMLYSTESNSLISLSLDTSVGPSLLNTSLPSAAVPEGISPTTRDESDLFNVLTDMDGQDHPMLAQHEWVPPMVLCN